MPLTPADVHNVAFSKPPIGKRGYNEDEVDAFLDMVEQELARLVEENNDLKHRLEELDQQAKLGGPAAGASSVNVTKNEPSAAKDADQAKPETPVVAPAPVPPTAVAPAQPAFGQSAQQQAATPTPAAAGTAPEAPTSSVAAAQSADSTGVDPADHHLRAAKILGLAQEMADRLTGEAKAESEQLVGGARTKSEATLSDAKTRSEQMLSDAKSKSEQMLAEAKSKSEQMVTEARTKSEAMLSDAKTRSETMQRQAKERADSLQAESERKHTEMISTITEKRTGLEKHIDELSTFEREYRSRLKSYLESQLHELGQRGGAAPADSVRGGADVPAGQRAEQGN